MCKKPYVQTNKNMLEQQPRIMPLSGIGYIDQTSLYSIINHFSIHPKMVCNEHIIYISTNKF